jgi:1-acyl-sn-glycerol-3-phosphate acyltransferase
LEASRSLELAKKRIREGKSIVVFPEGTIPDNAPVLNRFKSGAFKLAIEMGVPVVPVTFLDHWALMSEPTQLFGHCRPGISRVIVHDPIETNGLTEKDIVPLQEKVFAVIEKDLKQYVYPRIKNI